MLSMIKRLLPILFAGSLLASTSACAEEKPHPIDKWLETALAKDQTTAGTLDATEKAQQMWDKELKKVYKHLASQLNEPQKETLKRSQTNWLVFRDSEFKVIDDVIRAQQGSLWSTISAGEKLNIVRARVMQLQAYEDSLEIK
jgi:uncharacterized protein YecT (DUF1311 family)